MFRIIIVLFLLKFGFIWSQKPTVVLEVDPKNAEAGTLLTIMVKSNVQGEIDIEFPSAFVQGYNVMSGMEEEMDYNTGKIKQLFYLTQTGVINKEGTFTLGPAYVKKGNRTFKSNTVVVKIGKNLTQAPEEITAKQLRKPAFGIILKNKDEIYEGEPLILTSKVYAKFNATQFDNYQSYQISGTVKDYPLSNNGRIIIEEEVFKGVEFLSFEHDKKLFFPKQIGKITIEPFKMYLKQGFDAYPLISNKAVVTVKPLPNPSPKDFYGGVGSYKITQKINAKKLKIGDVFTVILTLEGEGNLHQVNAPKFKHLKGLKVYGDPKVEEEITFGIRGAEGKITYTFNLMVENAGDIELPSFTYSYFDVNAKKYKTLQTDALTLAVEGQATVKGTNASNSKGEEHVFTANKTAEKEGSNALIFILSGGLILSVGIILWLALAKKKERNTEKTVIQKEVTNIKEETITLVKEMPGSIEEMEKQLKHNLSILFQSPYYSGINTLKTQLLTKLSDTEFTEIENWLQAVEARKFGLGLSDADDQALKTKYAQIHSWILTRF